MKYPASLLPVIDMKDGQVVHAVAGQRHLYQPLQSQWTPHAHDPLQLIQALYAQWGMQEFYVADLNALEGRGHHHLEIVSKMTMQGCRIWFDGGISTPEEVSLVSAGFYRTIVAGELLSSLDWVQACLDSGLSKRLVFSLDLYQGKVRSRSELVPGNDPIDIVDDLVEAGLQHLIILDTASVGTAAGPTTLGLCEQIANRHPQLFLVSGGGVRNLEDIHRFEQVGVDHVLVSTWLHQGPTTSAP